MIYSPIEQKKIHRILAFFHDFIQNYRLIDILYSDKIGYLMISIEHQEVESVNEIHSSSQLIRLLIDELISSVAEADPDHIEETLSESEKIKCRTLLASLLAGASEDERKDFMSIMELSFQAYS